VDETAFLAATPTAGTVFATGIVALNGRARLLDVVNGRSGKALCDWVSGREPAWRDRISVAALDPYRGYATALRTSLPHAVRVLDAFHVVRVGPDALDQVRRRVQQDTLGHRGHAADPPVRDPPVAAPWLRTPQRPFRARMLAGLAAGDEDEQVGRAWIAAQELRLLYREPTRDRAERRLLRWFTAVAEHEIPELIHLQRTHRSGQRSDQEGETRRARLPQLRQLSAPPPPALRHRLAHSHCHPNQRAATTLGCVEPGSRTTASTPPAVHDHPDAAPAAQQDEQAQPSIPANQASIN
jgi:hypothetical protein